MKETISQNNLGAHLAFQVRALRALRGLTQKQLADRAEIPRATLASLESGAANPTLLVLAKVASSLQVPIEELIRAPRAEARLLKRANLDERTRGNTKVRNLLGEKLPGLIMERLELEPGARLGGVPHTRGTREYLACEQGEIVVVASGERYELQAGDVVVFRGDQKHSYLNEGRKIAIGFSVVSFAPPLVLDDDP